jgi:hypothetical protein
MSRISKSKLKQLRQSRRNHRVRKVRKVDVADRTGRSPVDDSIRRDDRQIDYKTIGILIAATFYVVGVLSDLAETLEWIDRIVAGYRQFYASIWRSIFSPLPNSLRLFDAQQTYDALTISTLLLAGSFGKKALSDRYFHYEIYAVVLLGGLFQLGTIRIQNRSLADIAANTAVDLLLLGTCFAASLYIQFRSALPFEIKRRLQFGIGACVFGTLIVMTGDSPYLLYSVVLNSLPSEYAGQSDMLRHVVFSTVLLTALTLTSFLVYVIKGPRKPLIALSVGIGVTIWLISLFSQTIRTALAEANMAM